MWYYNIFDPSPGDYLVKLSETILIVMDHQIYKIDIIAKYFHKIMKLEE
jgi:hypothetical protein